MNVGRTAVVEVPMLLREDAVTRALEGREEWAKAGRHAWEALTWTGESPVVPLIDFQEYIWYQLPVKYLVGLDHKFEILGGLQRMLEMLGYAHHAALCGSMPTIGSPTNDQHRSAVTPHLTGHGKGRGAPSVGKAANRELQVDFDLALFHYIFHWSAKYRRRP